MEERTKKRIHSEIEQEEKADSEFFVYTSETAQADIPKETLTHLRVDSSVAEIPDRTFEDCKVLMHLQLPETLTRIGKFAFETCIKLKFIQFVSDAPLQPSMSHPDLEEGTIVFPQTAKLHIDCGAFMGCLSFRKVIICSVSTTRLGKAVFSCCTRLLSFVLPEGLEVIETSFFWGCSSLESVKIPPSVIKIEKEAFSNCPNLSSVDLPPCGLLEIGNRSFYRCCSLETLHIPSTVASIGSEAFSGCRGLKNIILPPTSAVDYIGDRAFSGCLSLSHFRMSSSVKRCVHTAFDYCGSLISIELPEGGFFDLDFSSSSYSLVNFVAPPRHKYEMNGNNFSCRSKLYKAAEGDDRNGYHLLHDGIGYLLIHKLKHRFDHSPLNKLCYYHSYHSSADAMVQLRSLMEDDPLAATMQTDEFGMTPLHVLSLSQSPNMDMLLALMKEGKADHVVQSRDRFGSTPMDYLCLNHMPNSAELIRAVLETRFDHWLMGSVSEGSSKSETTMRQAVDEALAAEDGPSRSKEIVRVYFELVKYEHRMKILSLLELCLWQIKIDEISSKGQNVDRESCRVSSGAPIVIPHVLPFLDKLQVEDYVFSSSRLFECIIDDQ